MAEFATAFGPRRDQPPRILLGFSTSNNAKIGTFPASYLYLMFCFVVEEYSIGGVVRVTRKMVGFKSFVVRLIFALFFLASLPSPTNGSVDPTRLPQFPSMEPQYSVAVEGVIYCKCQLPGYLESLNASPLPGAVAQLLCYNGKQRVLMRGITDVRGYFLIRTTHVPSSMIPTCRLFLAKSPLPGCDAPTQGKWRGFPLKFERNITVGSTQQALYTTGLFEVGPATAASCPHHP